MIFLIVVQPLRPHWLVSSPHSILYYGMNLEKQPNLSMP